MSKLYFDYLLDIDHLAKYINAVVESSEEREELWSIIDEIIHHRILGVVLDHLPYENHDEFVEYYFTYPHSDTVMVYLNSKISQNVDDILKQELGNIANEIIGELTS